MANTLKGHPPLVNQVVCIRFDRLFASLQRLLEVEVRKWQWFPILFHQIAEFFEAVMERCELQGEIGYLSAGAIVHAYTLVKTDYWEIFKHQHGHIPRNATYTRLENSSSLTTSDGLIPKDILGTGGRAQSAAVRWGTSAHAMETANRTC